jgi:Matrixin
VARLLISLIAAIALLLPASAAADSHHTRGAHSASKSGASRRHTRTTVAASTSKRTRDPVALAVTIAERYWGSVPCGGQITLATDMPVPSGMDPTTDGWVTFESSLGANNLAAPAGTYAQCTIGLARWQWPTTASITSDWNMFCLTVIHETGHLLGHVHSLTPGSVMAPVFTDESDVPRICKTTTP